VVPERKAVKNRLHIDISVSGGRTVPTGPEAATRSGSAATPVVRHHEAVDPSLTRFGADRRDRRTPRLHRVQVLRSAQDSGNRRVVGYHVIDPSSHREAERAFVNIATPPAAKALARRR